MCVWGFIGLPASFFGATLFSKMTRIASDVSWMAWLLLAAPNSQFFLLRGGAGSCKTQHPTVLIRSRAVWHAHCKQGGLTKPQLYTRMRVNTRVQSFGFRHYTWVFAVG